VGRDRRGRAIWTIPAARSKNRKPHTVYLSDAALAVLDQARALREPGKNAPLFPGRKPGEPLSVLAVTRAVKRLHPAIEAKVREFSGKNHAEVDDFTLHDLRRTAASLVTSLGFSRFIAGLLLNHTDPSVTAIYDRNTYQNERRRAWAALGERVAALKPNL
jgi:integrase